MNSGSEFCIFRETRRGTLAPPRVAALRAKLVRLPSLLTLDDLAHLLLQAGELECGLCDVQEAELSWEPARRITDAIAEAVLDDTGLNNLRLTGTVLPILDRVHYRGEVSISVPEGFAYYALHPLDYASLVDSLSLKARTAFVIGIRTIGATLSAVVAARLRKAGVAAERFTVRPTGDPYDRECHFNAAQRASIAASANAEFLVCDEGPGRSGSSLLSVAEALEKAGVSHSRISILCSHEPDVSGLCAPDAARRWSRYRIAAAGMTRRLPTDAKDCLGGGEWRRKLIPAGYPWPALWPQMERLRYSSDAPTLLTFEGHGEYGAVVRSRNEAVAGAKFGPAYLGQELGFGRYTIEEGAPLTHNDMSQSLLRHMARYCAWRASAFAVTCTDTSQMENMTRVNYKREFGVELETLLLPVEQPTICDSRMMPHEWLQTRTGHYLKLDAAIHGDDHFFPGPCDIAWDLAGITIEWDLSSSQSNFLLASYRELSGDNISHRATDYEVAYATFRMSWSKMAAHSVGGGEEAERLLSDYRRYRRWLETRTKKHVMRMAARSREHIELNAARH